MTNDTVGRVFYPYLISIEYNTFGEATPSWGAIFWLLIGQQTGTVTPDQSAFCGIREGGL